MKMLVMTVWCTLTNLFIIPLCFYGSTLTPDSFDEKYAMQIFLAILSGIVIGVLTENYFEFD